MKDQCLLKLIYQLVESDELDQAIEACQILEADSFNKGIAIEEIVKQLLRMDQLKQALQFAQAFKQSEDQLVTLELISKGLAEQGKLERALRLAESMTQSQQKESAVGAVVDRLVAAGHIQQALSIIQRHADLDLLANTFDPFLYHDADHEWHQTIPVYQQIVNHFIIAKKYQHARKVTHLLQDPQQRDTATQYLVGELVIAEQYDEVLDIAIHYPGDSYSRSDIQSATVDNLVEAGQTPLAEKLAELLQNRDLLAQAKARHVMQVARKGELEQAQKMVSNITHLKWKPEAQAEIVSALIHKQQFDTAIEMVKKIEHASLKPEAEETLITALIESDRQPQAIGVACDIWDPKFRAPALLKVAEQLATKPLLKKNPFFGNMMTHRIMKTTFAPEEQQLARRIVDAINAD